MAKATTLPRQNPTSMVQWTVKHSKSMVGAKHTPREPRDGEKLVNVKRPQVGPYEFLEFAKGDLIECAISDHWGNIVTQSSGYVVVAAKPGYGSGGEGRGGWRVWGQVIIIRPATDADRAAVAVQTAAKAAEGKQILDGMMNS